LQSEKEETPEATIANTWLPHAQRLLEQDAKRVYTNRQLDEVQRQTALQVDLPVSLTLKRFIDTLVKSGAIRPELRDAPSQEKRVKERVKEERHLRCGGAVLFQSQWLTELPL